MRKFTWVCLIICLVFVVLGGICFGTGIALGSSLTEIRQMARNGEFSIGDFGMCDAGVVFDDDTEEYDNKDQQSGGCTEQFAADGIKQLYVAARYGAVALEESSSDQIEVTVKAPKKYVYVCEVEGDKFYFKDMTKNLHSSFNNIEITIAVPKDMEFEDVDLTTNAGTLYVNDAIIGKNVDVEVDAGEFSAGELTASEQFTLNVGAGRAQIDNINVTKCDMKCGMGEIDIAGKINGDGSVDCGMGKINMNLEGNENDYDYTINCGVGSVNLNGHGYGGMSCENRIDNGADYSLDLNCGMGEIDLMVK